MHVCTSVCVCVCVWPHFFSRRAETVYKLQHIPQERWSLHCSQPQPFFFNPLSAREIYTRNQHSGKTKEGDEQPPKDQSFQRLFVKMLEPEARRDSLDFLEDGAQAMKRDFLYM